jgi:hypothetical protein
MADVVNVRDGWDVQVCNQISGSLTGTFDVQESMAHEAPAGEPEAVAGERMRRIVRWLIEAMPAKGLRSQTDQEMLSGVRPDFVIEFGYHTGALTTGSFAHCVRLYIRRTGQNRFLWEGCAWMPPTSHADIGEVIESMMSQLLGSFPRSESGG